MRFIIEATIAFVIIQSFAIGNTFAKHEERIRNLENGVRK